MTPSSPPTSIIYSIGLPCQICGLERASPCEGIIDYLPKHQKGTVSLEEAHHDPQFWNG